MNIKTKRNNKNKDTTILMECLKTVTSIFTCKVRKVLSTINATNKETMLVSKRRQPVTTIPSNPK